MQQANTEIGWLVSLPLSDRSYNLLFGFILYIFHANIQQSTIYTVKHVKT